LEKPWSPACRIYLTGQVTVELDGRFVRERDFPSPQALVAFVFLAAERRRTITAEQLADAVWNDRARPAAWDAALSAILSRTRSLLQQGLATTDLDITRRFGRVRLELPPSAWVDIEAAASAIDEADGHVRAGRLQPAWAAANVAACVTRDALLPDRETPWLEGLRARQRAIAARALRLLSDVSLQNGESDLAILHAQQLVDLDPLIETSYGHLMRVHAALGNRGGALRVYAQCRERLRDELGASPSAETEGLYLKILRE
jgi:DNA-binding SARP family transcriptional activator